MNSSWVSGTACPQRTVFSNFTSLEDYRRKRNRVLASGDAAIEFHGTLDDRYIDEIIWRNDCNYIHLRPLAIHDARMFADAVAAAPNKVAAYAVILIAHGELTCFVLESRQRTVAKNFLKALQTLAPSVVFNRPAAKMYAEKHAQRLGINISIRDFADMPPNAKIEAVCNL